MWRYEYDRPNRIVRSIDPEGEVEETHFDKKGRPTESWSGKAGALQKLQSIAYDRVAPKGVPSGVKLVATAKNSVREVELDVREQVRVVTEKDISGEVKTRTFYEYTRDGLVTKIRTNDGTRDYESLYTYDGLGRIKSESTPGWGTTSYNYLNAGRQLQVVQPYGGTTDYFFGVGGLLEKHVDAEKKETRFEYDDAGRVSSILTPRGSKADHLYDKVGNLKRLTSTLPGESAQSWQWQYNLRGDVVSHADAATSTTYLRDALGRTVSSETDYGHFKKSHGYSYLS